MLSVFSFCIDISFCGRVLLNNVDGTIKTEADFLLECRIFDTLKQKHNLAELSTIQHFMDDTHLDKLG